MVSQIGNIKPLREYLNDKKEMIEQMFSCIEDHQLKKMIPDVLKEANIEDIKAECLVELLGMSRKRIIGILEGKELDESSEDSLELSDISDVEIQVKKEGKSPDKAKKRKGKKDSKGNKSSKKSRKESSTESEENSDEDEDSEKEETPPKKKKQEPKKKKKDEKSPPKETTAKKAVKETKKKSNDVIKEKQNKVLTVNADLDLEIPKEKGGKNLLEILELEMRARAIRSLIDREEKKNKDKQPSPQPSTSENNIDDGDPDAVIVIDEATEEIDLTKNDSDTEETNTNKDKNKTIQDDLEELSDDDVVIITDKDDKIDKNEGDNANENQSVKESISTQLNENTSQENKNDTNSGDVPKSWTERWLESKDVQKVMKTSKVMTNLKKRLINVNKQKSLEEKSNEVEGQKDIVIEGTVNEFFQLPSKKKDQAGTEENTDVNNGDDEREDEVDKSNADDMLPSNIEDETVYSLSFEKLPVSSDDCEVTVATCEPPQDIGNCEISKSEQLVDSNDNKKENKQDEMDEAICKETNKTEMDEDVSIQVENVEESNGD